MKDERYFSKLMINFVKIWSTPIEPIESEPPVLFNDNLAFSLFVNNLSRIVYRAYRKGIRDEQKRRKRKAVEKYRRQAVEGGKDEKRM